MTPAHAHVIALDRMAFLLKFATALLLAALCFTADVGANGSKIQRSAAARHAFARQTGYPHGRPGYVIDHIVPLACGGEDRPSNMQWQTIAEAKEKDKVERKGCATAPRAHR